ncbi:YHS domain-containing (seleno)protein [Vibrio mediterranei]|uniref:YHS domain-containing (seleno)protein n=1 Tax=Vibrio mediterranei TaxID=689 RepID=UPI00148D67AE|nr:YHS domain-containing (seleno)protein [Vibrio mediterranei]NOH31478.1 YHS domain-containing protein [Vibrio mediterranei]
MKYSARLFSIILMWLSSWTYVYALEPIYSDFFGKAIKGYDPVAYFTAGKPLKGDSDITYEWNGAKWYFSTQENRQQFVSNPTAYAPQYGGYCAWAVSQGYTASIDPNAWYIFENKLYLNYSKSVQKNWQKDISGNVQKADLNWPVLLKN